jgi:hypothetical protein
LSQLTRQDLDDLIDAVEAWENSGDAGEMAADLMGAMLCRGDDPKMKAEVERATFERKRELKAKKRIRKERSIMLRAKLLQIRDGVEADSLLADSSR